MKNALQVLQDVFGYAAFRPPQQEIIDTVIDGGDALVLMPTGGGKSLCYQIPALVRRASCQRYPQADDWPWRFCRGNQRT